MSIATPVLPAHETPPLHLQAAPHQPRPRLRIREAQQIASLSQPRGRPTPALHPSSAAVAVANELQPRRDFAVARAAACLDDLGPRSRQRCFDMDTAALALVGRRATPEALCVGPALILG